MHEQGSVASGGYVRGQRVICRNDPPALTSQSSARRPSRVGKGCQSSSLQAVGSNYPAQHRGLRCIKVMTKALKRVTSKATQSTHPQKKHGNHGQKDGGMPLTDLTATKLQIPKAGSKVVNANSPCEASWSCQTSPRRP